MRRVAAGRFDIQPMAAYRARIAIDQTPVSIIVATAEVTLFCDGKRVAEVRLINERGRGVMVTSWIVYDENAFGYDWVDTVALMRAISDAIRGARCIRDAAGFVANALGAIVIETIVRR